MAERMNLKPYAFGLVVTVVVVVGIWISVHHVATPSGVRDDAYAAHVSITGATVSAAESMMGGGVVYYNGTLRNDGDRTLTSYSVALTFTDPYGKPLETDTRSLLDDHLKPLPPHSDRSFEIGFDKTPAGWNQAPPTPKAVAVYVR